MKGGTQKELTKLIKKRREWQMKGEVQKELTNLVKKGESSK
jgi:hypothetical protein